MKNPIRRQGVSETIDRFGCHVADLRHQSNSRLLRQINYTRFHSKATKPCFGQSDALRDKPKICGWTSKNQIQVAEQIGSHRALPVSQYWNHVDRGNLVHHTVDTMMERAVEIS